MPSFLQDVYCCCNVFPVTYGLYLIAFHCLLQGIYGVGVVVTSTHLDLFLIVNFCVAVSFGLLIPAGIAVMWTNLYESWKGARVTGLAIFGLSIANLATAILYFVQYFKFKANSLLDKVLFWVNGQDWVDGNDYPFLFWHVLVFFLIFMAPLWWYYAYVLYTYSKRMKLHRGKKIKLRLPKHKSRSKHPRKPSQVTQQGPKAKKSKEPEKEEQGPKAEQSKKRDPRRCFHPKKSKDKKEEGRPPKTPPKLCKSSRSQRSSPKSSVKPHDKVKKKKGSTEH